MLTLAGALGLAFYASWRLTLLALLVLPVAATLLGWIGRTMRRRSTRAQERMSDLTAILHETITGARVVRAFGAERFETEKLRRTNQQFYDAYARMRRVALAARPFSEFALVLVALAMLWFGGREIFTHHTLAPHQFVLFVTALLTTVSPTKSVAEVSTNIQQGMAAARRLFDLMDTASEIRDEPGAAVLPPFREAIRYENVSFAYPDGPHGAARRARSRSAAARSWRWWARAERGRARPWTCSRVSTTRAAGASRWMASTCGTQRVASLRAQLGIVTQETILFHDTVRNNIAYGTQPLQRRGAAARRRRRRTPTRSFRRCRRATTR